MNSRVVRPLFAAVLVGAATWVGATWSLIHQVMGGDDKPRKKP